MPNSWHVCLIMNEMIKEFSKIVAYFILFIDSKLILHYVIFTLHRNDHVFNSNEHFCVHNRKTNFSIYP